MKWLLLSVVVLVGWWSDRAFCRILVEDQDVDSEPAELWAVLVAGSNHWYNYRHQADVCHAYQILHQHGVPDDHIIVMMYDDIAYNAENPRQGVIINRPDGPNVYEGVLKDYTTTDVTPENFLNILMGNASAMAGIGSGKVVKSTHRDRIFINLVDHGAPGIFGFPDTVLHASDLADTVLQLHRDRKFKEMVIYVEACESGSIFKNLLPNDIGVYALTASSPHEPSYACYDDDEIGTYLGDVFSIKWMEDTDRENIHRDTLKKQFHLVHREVVTSKVMQWGEHDINREKLWKFMGERNYPKKDSVRYHTNSIHYQHDESTSKQEVDGIFGISDKDEDDQKDNKDPCISSAVSSPDVPIAILQSRMMRANDANETEYWNQELTSLHINRLLVHVVMRALVKEMTQDDEEATKVIMEDAHNITRWDCYDRSVDTFHDLCFNLGQNPYALRVLQMAVNLCEHGYSADKFLEAAETVCIHPKFTGIN